MRGSWWSHPKGNEIFLLSRAIRESPEVLVCRIAGGKVTYVHRRLWPALVLLAGRFSKKSLAAIKEIHTPLGKHKVVMTPFPDWVPKEVLRAARELQEQEATSQLAAILDERSEAQWPKGRKKTSRKAPMPTAPLPTPDHHSQGQRPRHCG